MIAIVTHPSRNNGAGNGRRPLKGPSMRIAMGTLALLAAVVSAQAAAQD